MYMDLTDMISGGTEEQPIPEQKLTKEEYAAKKQQEREEVWAEVDSQAQGVFQNGEKLKGFLDLAWARGAGNPCNGIYRLSRSRVVPEWQKHGAQAETVLVGSPVYEGRQSGSLTTLSVDMGFCEI